MQLLKIYTALVSLALMALHANAAFADTEVVQVHLEAETRTPQLNGTEFTSNSDAETFAGPGAFTGTVHAAPSVPDCSCGSVGDSEATSTITTVKSDDWILSSTVSGGELESSATATLRFRRTARSGTPAAVSIILLDLNLDWTCDAVIRFTNGAWAADLRKLYLGSGTSVVVPAGGDFEIVTSIPSVGGSLNLQLQAPPQSSTLYASFANASATASSECLDYGGYNKDNDYYDGSPIGCDIQGASVHADDASARWDGSESGCFCERVLEFHINAGEPVCDYGESYAAASFHFPHNLTLTQLEVSAGSSLWGVPPSPTLPMVFSGTSDFSFRDSKGTGFARLHFTVIDVNGDGIGDPNQQFTDCNNDGEHDACTIYNGEGDLDCNLNGVLDSCEGLVTDCNNNGYPDLCEIINGWWESQDFDGDFLIDTCERIRGDANLDGFVNARDLALVLVAWGPSECWDQCPADLNWDYAIDDLDLALVISQWGDAWP